MIKCYKKIAIILHLYYLELLPEILHYLSNIPLAFDLIITAPQNIIDPIIENISPLYPTCLILPVENQGRDIAPFFIACSKINLNKYLCICKIHTKKTIRTENGSDWRYNLFNGVLGSKQIVTQIINLFLLNNHIGIIAPSGNILKLENFLGSNQRHLASLTNKLNLSFDIKKIDFIAGGIFWFRPKAIAQLVNLKLSLNDFESEDGQVDGTLAHAIERLFMYCALQNKFITLESDTLNTTAMILNQSDIPFHDLLKYHAPGSKVHIYTPAESKGKT